MASTPVFLSGESHGQRSLVGCSPWGRKESDTTEHLTLRSRNHATIKTNPCVRILYSQGSIAY